MHYIKEEQLRNTELVPIFYKKGTAINYFVLKVSIVVKYL